MFKQSFLNDIESEHVDTLNMFLSCKLIFVSAAGVTAVSGWREEVMIPALALSISLSALLYLTP